MHLFYSVNRQDDQLVLDEEESRHAISVMRLKEGDQFMATDGKGNLFSCLADHIGKKILTGKIVSTELRSPEPHRLHIAIAPTKNTDRLEWFLEKACEFGIGKVTPVICDRSERRELRTDRLQKILVSAMKQSLQTRLPHLEEPVPFRKFLETELPGQRFIAHCMETEKQHLFELIRPEMNTLVLVGPEGDFTPAEVDFANERSFVPVSLGNSRLRTETAGISVAQLFGLKTELQS